MEFSLIHVLFGEKSYSYWVLSCASCRGDLDDLGGGIVPETGSTWMITIRVARMLGPFFCGTCWAGRQWLASGSALPKSAKGILT